MLPGESKARAIAAAQAQAQMNAVGQLYGQGMGAAAPYIGSPLLGGQAAYPYIPTTDVNRMSMQQGDVIIRQVRNGYTAEVYQVNSQTNHTYVAETLESLFEAIKLALVNHKLDAAK